VVNCSCGTASIAYVNVNGLVPFNPVMVTSGSVELTHTIVEPVIVAEGRGFTTNVVLEVTLVTQLKELDS
jgi:hypothetical protein